MDAQRCQEECRRIPARIFLSAPAGLSLIGFIGLSFRRWFYGFSAIRQCDFLHGQLKLRMRRNCLQNCVADSGARRINRFAHRLGAVGTRARSSQRASSGSAIKSRVFAAMVVSSFMPVAWPTPTIKSGQQQRHAQHRAARIGRQRAGALPGRARGTGLSNSGSVHIAGFFAGEKASKKMACGAG